MALESQEVCICSCICLHLRMCVLIPDNICDLSIIASSSVNKDKTMSKIGIKEPSVYCGNV